MIVEVFYRHKINVCLMGMTENIPVVKIQCWWWLKRIKQKLKKLHSCLPIYWFNWVEGGNGKCRSFQMGMTG